MPVFTTAVVPLLALAAGFAPAAQPRTRPEPPPQDQPWRGDLRSFILKGDTPGEHAFFAGSAGVPCLARSGSTVYAVFQWFPQSDPDSFDQVALSRSLDQGRSWTPPRRITVKDLPKGFQRPYDPTIVPAGDDLLRLYFTSSPDSAHRQRSDQAIYSAASRDGGETWVFEPGVRLKAPGLAGAADSAVAKLSGKDGDVWHMLIPASPGARDEVNRPAPATAYHVTSKDGLTFTTPELIEWDGPGRWIGNLLVADGQLVFFGSPASPGGSLWKATSKDGVKWSKPTELDLGTAGGKGGKGGGGGGGDPAVVRLESGSILVVYAAPATVKPPAGPPPGEGPGEEWPRRPGVPAEIPR